MNNNLKAIMNFVSYIGANSSLLDIQRKEPIIQFLDTKIKSSQEDPDGRWITTWNHYLSHLKYYFRWLHNVYNKKNSETLF
jgi:integrase/recombinase XerD